MPSGCASLRVLRKNLKEITAKIPLGKRMTTPNDIAAMVVFLISGQASCIAGQHRRVDGGYTQLDRAPT